MKTPWDTFFDDKCLEIFTTSNTIIDVGEGLRARDRVAQGIRFVESRAWLQEYIDKVDYKVMDLFPEFEPDIIGDIHDIPLEDKSQDALICLAVLEHVPDPFTAIREMYRVLKPGGKLLLYVPFLYYYHVHGDIYKDYWRYTYDGLVELAKPFTSYELQSVRGRFETLLWLTPLGKMGFLVKAARFMDRIFPKPNSRQVSGYYMYLVK